MRIPATPCPSRPAMLARKLRQVSLWRASASVSASPVPAWLSALSHALSFFLFSAAPLALFLLPVATASAQATSEAARTKPAAAGTFEIDEDSAQRALERTLTQTGALLLAPGTFEFTPGLLFSRAEQTSPILLSFTSPLTGQPTTAIAESRVRRNEFTARADLRYGLPFDAQAELSLPYSRFTGQQNNTFGAVESSSANGPGDVSLGLARTFTRERGALPDVIGRVSWNTGSGRQFAAPLSNGAGFPQLQAEVVAVKRQDPLAFVASASYAHVFEKDGVRPGAAMVLSLSALLAASPSTSLQLGFAQVVRGKQELQGVRQDGSDQTYGLVTLGASSVLSRDVTVVTQFGIGLGNDAPKYTISIAFPMVFR